MTGMVIGNIAGTVLAVAIVLIIHPGIFVAFLLGVSLSLIGGFVGRTAYR